jgi:hypothetical protein
VIGFFVAADGPGTQPGNGIGYESGSSGTGDGTGLGLAFVERIAGPHGRRSTSPRARTGVHGSNLRVGALLTMV